MGVTVPKYTANTTQKQPVPSIGDSSVACHMSSPISFYRLWPSFLPPSTAEDNDKIINSPANGIISQAIQIQQRNVIIIIITILLLRIIWKVLKKSSHSLTKKKKMKRFN